MGVKDVLAKFGLVDADNSGDVSTDEVIAKPEESAALLNELKEKVTQYESKIEENQKLISDLNVLKRDIDDLSKLSDDAFYRITPSAKNKLVSIMKDGCVRAFIFHADGVYQVSDGSEHRVGSTLSEIVSKLNSMGETNADSSEVSTGTTEYVFDDGTTIVQED